MAHIGSHEGMILDKCGLPHIWDKNLSHAVPAMQFHFLEFIIPRPEDEKFNPSPRHSVIRIWRARWTCSVLEDTRHAEQRSHMIWTRIPKRITGTWKVNRPGNLEWQWHPMGQTSSS